MKIAIYGGSFNPPHLGHEEVVKTILKELDVDKLLIIPDYLPPHKELSADAPSPEQRLEMCRIAFGDIDGTEVSDMEILRGGRSYTSETLSRLREEYADSEFYLVVGSDMLLSFKTWHEYEYILDNCHLAVVTRTGDDTDELKEALLGDSQIIEHIPVVVSSTDIRENIDMNKEFLDEKVYNYIKENHLYENDGKVRELTVEIDDTEMTVIRFGNGKKTMAILSGISLLGIKGLGEMSAGAYKIFTQDYTVYLFDRKKAIPEGYSTEEMAEDVYRVLKSFGVEKAEFYGVSHGGMMLQCIAVNHPEIVDKMVLCSSQARTNEEAGKVFDKWEALCIKGNVRELNHAVIQDVYSEEYINKYSDALAKFEGMGSAEDVRRFLILVKACNCFNIYDRLDEIKCPVLVLGDENDHVTTADASVELADKLKSELIIYNSYSHAVYDECPDVKDRVLEFFES